MKRLPKISPVHIIARLVLLLISLSHGAHIVAQDITVDDLLPPVDGGTREVQNPQYVSLSDNLVQAATAQDAVNAATDHHQDIQDERLRASFVMFGSGMGAVATGQGTYAVAEDQPILTQISQREAYVVAYNQAKKNMASLLSGYQSESNANMNSALTRLAAAQGGSGGNTRRISKMTVKHTLTTLLKGFVVYDVAEDPDRRSVSVTIAATPKTLGKVERTAGNRLVVDDLRYGMEQILTEVKGDLVPPVGGRVLTVNSTGETAVIGFGSYIIPTHTDPSVQSQQRRQAFDTATEYASDVLCGLLTGDRVTWNGGSSVVTTQEYQDFEKIANDDPLQTVAWQDVQQLEQQRLQFTRKFQRTADWQSVRQGQLPPGVILRTWRDGDWAYAMAVYVPSVTNFAAGLAKQMQEGSLLKPVDAAAFHSPGDAEEPRVRRTFRPRPTGRVNSDNL